MGRPDVDQRQGEGGELASSGSAVSVHAGRTSSFGCDTAIYGHVGNTAIDGGFGAWRRQRIWRRMIASGDSVGGNRRLTRSVGWAGVGAAAGA